MENKSHDNVNHPSHYCRDGAMECIKEMQKVFGTEIVAAFCLCNVWKYRYRASEKGHEEDLRKSDFYMKELDNLLSCMNALNPCEYGIYNKGIFSLKENIEKTLCGGK